ncbi:hypothetical protein ACFXKG_31545 [Streptomyces sp. NPDC059255]|uniref:hypothetical protein n=1 Tax=Streptomyces sp. NPDC059255 TaxID=3346793 RepID=UPI003693C523
MTKRQRHLRIMAVTAAAAFSLLTTACSGEQAGGGKEGEDSKGRTVVSEEGNKADQAFEYRKCLREQGLDVPEPKPGEGGQGMSIGGDGMSKEKVEKAIKACAGKGGAGGAREITQAEKDKALKFARCMRENGFDMPDPNFGGGGAVAGMPMPEGAEREKFDKANKACEGVSS